MLHSRSKQRSDQRVLVLKHTQIFSPKKTGFFMFSVSKKINCPQKLLIIGPNLFFHCPVQPTAHSPGLNFHYYEYVPRYICFLICDVLPTVAHYRRLHQDNGDTPIDLHLTIEIMKIANSNQVDFIILCSFFRSITITLWIQL